MKVILVQPDLLWEKPAENLDKLEELISSADHPADLILLPELFTTGFTMNAGSLSEGKEGLTYQWMSRLAGKFGAAIAGSIIAREKSKYYNRFLWVNPDTGYYHYDKRHLFRMGKEDLHFTPGKKQITISFRDWRIMPLVCYDLRFPVWSRNIFRYDLLVYAANWPAPRNEAWECLLRARAIENQSWVVGVNRVGSDGEGISYLGNSLVIDPKGKIVLRLDDREQTASFTLNLEELKLFRLNFPVLHDMDKFNLL